MDSIVNNLVTVLRNHHNDPLKRRAVYETLRKHHATNVDAQKAIAAFEAELATAEQERIRECERVREHERFIAVSTTHDINVQRYLQEWEEK